ncbi:hypothetical protein F5Y10DRAFT_239279 [Nemania abortiva]|nr:hypothetical protein F5Y10DRAFT_239279 [Nemania abortiva]
MASAGLNPGPRGGNSPVFRPWDSFSVDPGDLDQRPLSPWAQRFGREDGVLYSADLIRHSGVAPEYPRLHPRYYGDNPDLTESFRGFARGLDEDRLFWSESYQQSILHILAWQSATLNNFVSFSTTFPRIPGGNVSSNLVTPPGSQDPTSIMNRIQLPTGVKYSSDDEVLSAVYDLEKIRVDESTWFSFFKRSRWWDPDLPRDTELDLQWSIDDPKVWAEFSTILELANRILNALVDDQHPWLETILFGRLDYWRNVYPNTPDFNARVLLSRIGDMSVCQKLGVRSYFEVTALPDMRGRLEGLLQSAKWTFMDNPNSRAMGITDPTAGAIISIDINPLRYLFKATLAEKCLLTVLVAFAVLHELMHHINFARMKLDSSKMNNFLSPSTDPNPALEPFVDFDGAAEIGYAFEKAVLGGCLEHQLLLRVPVTVYIVTWPWRRAELFPRNLNHPVFEDTHQIGTWRIPAYWASRILSQSFWEDGTARKSDDSFHLTPIFISTTQNTRPEPDWGEVVVNRDVVTHINDIEKSLVHEWDERSNLWGIHRRDWYPEALDRWNETPWSSLGDRAPLKDFVSSFQARDEVDCISTAISTVIRLPWESDSVTFSLSLPPHDDKSWIFSAIGLLMLAACPTRTKKLRKGESSSVTLESSLLKPSKKAYSEAGSRGTINIDAKLNYKDEVEILPIVIGNRFRNIAKYEPGPTQFDYIDMVLDLVGHLANGGQIVSGPWLFEIIRCCRELRNERERIEQKQPSSYTTKWVSTWPFQIPEYSSPNVLNSPHYALWVKWDPIMDEWVDV